MKSPLSTLIAKADGGDGITERDWAEARTVAAQPEPDRLRKAASFFTTEWPDGWTGETLLANIRAGDYGDIVVRECFEMEEDETIAEWIQEVADLITPEPDLAAEVARLRAALTRAELSTVQIRMAADIGRSSAARREAWFRSQLAQLGREIREALDAKP